jgi:molecular chaperone DnaK
MDDVQEAKVLLAKARKANLRPIRQMELDSVVSAFDQNIRKYARPTEVTAFENLAKSAKRSIDNDSSEFESELEQLQGKLFMMLWRQDWFVVDRFNWYLQSPHFFASTDLYSELVQRGRRALSGNNVDELRKVVMEMDLNRIGSPDANDFIAVTNIVKVR